MNKLRLNTLIQTSVITIIFVLMFTYGYSASWFILPVTISFYVCLYHVLEYIKRDDIFSVKGVVWCLFLYFFSVSPILHYINDYYYHGFAIKLYTWDLYFSIWSWLNLVGLLIYAKVISYTSNRKGSYHSIPYNSIDDLKLERVLYIGCIFLVLSSVMQYYVYAKFGGISGYILAKEIDGVDAFKGMGLMVLVSESFPIIFATIIVVLFRKKGVKSNHIIYCSIFIFLIVKIIFGGLAGSRSNIIWGLFWFAGMIHIFVKPFSKKQLTLALIFLMAFMAIYGVYKKHRSSFSEAITSSGISDNNYYNSTNPFVAILLTDFSRADIQSYEIFSQSVGAYSNLRLGETYLNSINRIIPIGRDYFSFDSKTQAGTEIIFHSEGDYSTRLYGLVGEFMLNFPYHLYPIVFFPFALLVIYIDNFRKRKKDDDTTLLIYPFFVNLCIILLIADSDNVLYFILKNGFIPIIFILIISKLSFKRRLYAS